MLKAEAVVGFIALLIVELMPEKLISMIREVVFGVGFALLLPVFFGLDGVLYSMPVSDALTFVIAAFVIRRTMRELSDSAAQPESTLSASRAAVS